MDEFVKAREEFYGHLYRKFMEGSSPYCGSEEMQRLCEANPLMERARVFASDLGHLRQNKLGWYRLTAQGVLYAEEHYLGGHDGN